MLKIRERFRSWVTRRRSGGASAAGVALEFPRKVLRIGSNLVLQELNRIRGRVYERRYGAGLSEALLDCDRNPCVMVVVPGILHYAIPCLTLATRHVPVVLVANGTRRWEDEILEQKFPDTRMVKLHPVKGSMLPHGEVLDLVLRHATRSLTLLDPDLFVFNPRVFDEIELREGEVACGAYGLINRKAALVFPTTHLLTLNVPVVQELMARHRINPAICAKTPQHLTEPLATIGLGDHNYPKEHLAFYDPLNLILAMAAYEQLGQRVLNLGEAEIYHVGGVSYTDRNVNLDYFSARLLDLPFARSFRDRYAEKGDPDLARARVIEAGAESFLVGIDRAVERIAGELAAGSQST